MLEVTISQQSAESSDAGIHTKPLLEELVRIRKRKVRLYSTYVDSRSKNTKFTFVTTSKDIHLGFGMLSVDAQHHLARLLQSEFDRALLDHERGCHQMLLSIAVDVDHGEPVLVTRTIDKGIKEDNVPVLETFTFAPA